MYNQKFLIRSSRKKNKSISQINVTPFVDVMLVLLIVFMITAPLLTVGVSVDLPKTKAGQLNSKGDPIIVSIKENGDLFMEEVVVEEKHTPPITQIKTEMGDYPIIYKDMKKELETNDIVISDNIASSIIEWFNYFEKKTEIPFGYAEVTNEVGDTTLHTREGWDIIVRADSTTKDQIERLESVLREKVDRSKINYIDVRFKGRVYWQ